MQKPDFTGTWTFNQKESVLEIPAPDSTVMVIDHREPHFHLERTHVTGSRTDTFTIDLTTDDNAVTRVHEGVELHARMFWKDNDLVFDTEIRRGAERGKISSAIALPMTGTPSSRMNNSVRGY